jgi:putative flippase GtrA
MMFSNPHERTRFFRFAVVGIIGAVVDFGTMNALTLFAYMPFIPASMISFGAAVASNFLWNRFWTYPDSRSKAVARQIMQFILISIIGLAIRVPLLHWVEGMMVDGFARILPKGFLFSPRFMGHNLALAAAVLVVMMWNFLANRFWTYNDVQ